ncbi:hypothetical protein J1N35_026321 [Gossypium stocksii]|uniref:Uncharacterized protein n=1 Tax=Gossypium stocksii TaxID=47602 RepID=A0A9D3VAH5_9ROSI|nr:hypothetical protein J1N35_026321 [Gossypium stocksii]
MSFVDEVRKLENMYHMSRNIFSPIPDEHRWPPISSTPFKLLPYRLLHRKPKGRLASTWICDNMAIREKSNRSRLYEWCRNMVHTMLSCPHRRDDTRTKHH